MTTISATHSHLKRSFFNCIATVCHCRLDWIFWQILLILTGPQTLPSHRDYVTAFPERTEKRSQPSAKQLAESQTWAPQAGLQGEWGCYTVAHRHYLGSEEILVFLSRKQWRLTATCGQPLASAPCAIPRNVGARRSLAAMALLVKDPLSLKELQSHPPAKSSGLRCLTSRSLSSNQATGSYTLASMGLVFLGLC